MTADAFEESVRMAKDAGINDYITKPIEPQKLYSVLLHYSKKQKPAQGQKEADETA